MGSLKTRYLRLCTNELRRVTNECGWVERVISDTLKIWHEGASANMRYSIAMIHPASQETEVIA